jgi:hypothetical protein
MADTHNTGFKVLQQPLAPIYFYLILKAKEHLCSPHFPDDEIRDTNNFIFALSVSVFYKKK